jgi:UDP-N-acetylmuramate dehydrogenase
MDYEGIFKEAAAAGHVKFNYPLSRRTTFKIGGAADCLISPSSPAELLNIIGLCVQNGLKYYVLGNASNVLIADGGLRGAVIFTSGLHSAVVKGCRIYADAGASLAGLSKIAAKNGLGGLEFCCGIPATLGGGIVMNAGCYGGEIADAVESVRVALDGGTVDFSRADCKFGYRSSVFEGLDCVITAAVLRLERRKKSLIEQAVKGNVLRRALNTPVGVPSAGSAFKRPVGGYAARLIEDAGLKGCKIGNAAVSDIHAGFIVNLGGALASDVYALIKFVTKRVYEHSGILLEPEIKFLGEFN